MKNASVQELKAFQIKKLRWTLSHAYKNSEHYRKQFDSMNLRPEEFSDLSQLKNYPYLSKSILQNYYPYGFFAAPLSEIIRVHSSSGSQGNPVIVGYTTQDIKNWTELMKRSLLVAGVRPGDIVQIAYGYGLFTGGLGCHYATEALGCVTIPMSGGQTMRQVQMILDLKPRVIMCTPSYLMTIGDELETRGVDPSSTSLKIAILGAEAWTKPLQKKIESRFQIKAMDIYGLTEVIGPGVACESIEHQDGAIIWEDYFYPEIIDPLTEKILPEGEEGELVLTSLFKEAFPVIRYRTGDLTRLLPPTTGSMRRIDRITGRTDDLLIVRGIKIYPSQIENMICSVPELAGHYYIYLDKKNHLDQLTISVEMDSVLSHAEPATAKLKELIKGHFGISVEVITNAPGTLERIHAGKAKRVIDRR